MRRLSSALTAAFLSAALLIPSSAAWAANPAARSCLIDAITQRHESDQLEVLRVTLNCHSNGSVGYKLKTKNRYSGQIFQSHTGGWAAPDPNMMRMCGNPCR